MRKHFFLYTLLLFLSACNCGGPDIYEYLIYDSSVGAFVNDPANEPDYLYQIPPPDTFVCKADMLALRYFISDSLTQSLDLENGNCFYRKERMETVYKNVLQSMTVFSDQPFLNKASGESLNEFFLCANNNTTVPQDLNEENFLNLDHTFVLLLKPDLGLAANSNARIITAIKLSDRILYDTTQVILFQ